MEGSKNKRLEKRSDYRFRYLAEISYGSEYDMGNGFVQNISLGGMLVNASLQVPLGAAVLITVPFSNSRRYATLKGKVARVTEEGFAISFIRTRRDNYFDRGHWDL